MSKTPEEKAAAKAAKEQAKAEEKANKEADKAAAKAAKEQAKAEEKANKEADKAADNAAKGASATGEPITVKYRDHKGEPTERTFSKEVHGENFGALAEEFKATNAHRIISE